MKPVRNHHQRLERIGHSKCPHILRRSENREAMSLKPPELVVVHEVVQLLGDDSGVSRLGSSRV